MSAAAYRFFRVYWVVFLGGLICFAGVLFWGSEQYRSLLPEAPGKDWYLSYYQIHKAYSLDYDRFYYDIGGVIHGAKEADILVLGHSMTVFGFDWRRVERFAERWNVRIFHLGFLSEVSGEFPLALIRRYNLKPRIVIVNLDYQGRPAFLTDGMTPYARQVIAEGIVKRTVTACLADKVRWWLGDNPSDDISRVIYRSRRHGGSLVDHWPGYADVHSPFLIQRTACPGPTSQETEKALHWKNELHRRGSEMLLTAVPSRKSCEQATIGIAERIQVPFIAVDDRGMTSFDDGYHLDRQGAALFTDRFLQRLEGSIAFKQLVASKKSAR